MANTTPTFINVLTGGLKNYPPSYKLDTSEFQSIKNLLPTEHGSIHLRDGQSLLFNNVSGSQFFVRAFARFAHPSGTRFMYHTAGDLTNDTNTFARDEQTGLDILASGFGIRPYSRPVVFDDKYIWIAQPPNGFAFPQVWDFYNTFVLGISAPSTAPTVGIGTPNVGNLPSYEQTVNDPIYYYVTFYDPTSGQESNPSPVSATATPGWDAVDLTDIPTSSGKYRNIYRAGGGLPSPRLLGYVGTSGIIATIEDDSTTTYKDTQPNVGSLINLFDEPGLSFSHDPLPTDIDFTYLLSHGARLFAFGETTVAISNINEPWYFPLKVTFPKTDGGVIVLDGDRNNPIQAACAIGGGIWIGRNKDSWILQGVDSDTFFPSSIVSIGCVAPLSLVNCGNTPVWMAPDRQIWGFNGVEPVMLSAPIKEMLKTLTVSGARAVNACFARNGYEVSIPYYSGTVSAFLRYDFSKNAWTDLSFRYTSARYLLADTGKFDDDVTLMATGPYYQSPDGVSTAPGVVELFTDDLTDLDFEATSGDLPFGGLGEQKKITHVRVHGTLVPEDGETCYLRLHSITELEDGNDIEASISYPLLEKSAPGLLLNTDVEESIEGNRITWSVGGRASVCKIDAIEFSWSLIRDERS